MAFHSGSALKKMKAMKIGKLVECGGCSTDAPARPRDDVERLKMLRATYDDVGNAAACTIC